MKLPPKARASPRAALASVPLNPVSSKRPTSTPATTSRHGSASGSAAASASTRQASRPPASTRARSAGGTRSQSHSSTAGSTHTAASGGKSQSTSAPSSFSFHRQNTAPTSASNSSSAAASRAASFHRHVTPPTSTSTTTAAAASSTQFRRTSSSSLHAATFFSGLLFYVTGRSKAESVRAKELITTAGGTVVQRETDASHLVCISGAGVKKIEQALSLGALSNAQSFGTAPKRHLEMVRVAVATQNANTSSSTFSMPRGANSANQHHQVHSTSHFHQTASGGGAKFPDVVPASALHKGPRFVATLAWLEHCHRSRVLGALPTRKALLAEFCKAPEKEVIDRDEDDVVPATHAVTPTASSTATHQSTTSAKSAKSNGSGNGRCGTAPVLTSPRNAPLLVSSMPILTKPSSAKALASTPEDAAAIGSTATATATAATGADRKRSPFAAAAPPVVTRTKQQVTVGRTAPVPATTSVFTKSVERPFSDHSALMKGNSAASSRRTSRTDLKTTTALSARGAVGGTAAPPARKRGRPASVASSASASPATSCASDFDAAETSSDESVASDSTTSSATSSCFSSSTEEARDSTLDLLLSRQASRRASAVAYASSGEFGAASGASATHRRSIIDVDAVDEKLLYSPQISWEPPVASLQSGNALSLDSQQNDETRAKKRGMQKGSNGSKIGEDDVEDDVLNPLDFFQCERVLIAEAAHTIEQNRGHHQQRICIETGQPQSTPPRRHRRLSSEADAAFVSPNGGREGRGSTESGSSESGRFSSPMGRDLDARRSVHHRPHTDIEAFEQKFSELEEAREQMRKSTGPTKDASSRRARAIRAVSEPRPDEPRPDALSSNRGDSGVASKSHPKILIDDDEDMPPPAHLITSPTAPKAPKVRPTPKLSSPKLMSPDLPSTPCSAGSAAGVSAVRAMAPPKVPQAPPRREGKRTRSAVRQETAAAASLFSDNDTGCAEGASAGDGSKPLIAPAQDRPGRRHLVTIKSPSQERPAPAQDESAADPSGGKSRMGVRARLEADAERRKDKLAELVAAHETDLLHRSGVSRLRARTPPPSQTTVSAKSSKSTRSNALGDASSSIVPGSSSTAGSSKSKAGRTASSSAPVPARNGPMSASSASASNPAAKGVATTAGLQAPTSRPWAVKMQSANSSAPAAPSVLPSKGTPTVAGGSTKRPAPKRSERAVNDRSAQRHRLWERARSSQHTIGVVDDDALESILSQVVDHAKPILFSDVNGLDECKDILYEAVVLPTKRPELFTGLRKPCSGLLLFGPPGNGKTMLASAVACECGTTFFNISAASLTSRWMGEGEKMVRALFSVARALAPSTIFIDEIDSLLQARGSSSEHEASRRLKTEFLVQMEGAGNDVSGSHVLTMAATNRPGDLDDAVIRRFPRRVLVPLPDAPLRLMMVKKLLLGDAHADLSGATRTSKRARGSNSEDDEVKPRPSANSVRVSLSPKEWQYLADHTENFSGSDLKGLCTDLAFAPLRALPAPARLEVRPEDLRPVSFDDVRGVLGRTQPSTTLGQLQGLEEWNNKYGSSAA